MNHERTSMQPAKRWVIKIGSALLTENGLGLKHASMDIWIRQMAAMMARGREIVIVSSGAVAEGLTRLGWKSRPQQIHQLQAAAAIGQMGLIHAYEKGFQEYDKHTAQILLTHDDITNRERYLNARTSLQTLISLGVVPVINENDTVATDEIRFGDNDTLAGLVANLVDADVLVLLTDQNGLYTADPGTDSNAELISRASASDPGLRQYAGEGGSLGRGGMRTKLNAASIAARSGTETIIASGLEADVLLKLAGGKALGTLLYSDTESLNSRKQWLASHGHVKGSVVLDDGAVKALTENGRSLLPVGVKQVNGDFNRGEVVACVDAQGKEIARGLANYAAKQLQAVHGKSSREIDQLPGYGLATVFIQRDNLVLSEQS